MYFKAGRVISRLLVTSCRNKSRLKHLQFSYTITRRSKQVVDKKGKGLCLLLKSEANGAACALFPPPKKLDIFATTSYHAGGKWLSEL